MREIDLVAPGGEVVPEFEEYAQSLGLKVSRGSLRKYPGGVHWHLTHAGAKGTLEANWWPKTGRLWLSTHSNRTAPWQADIAAAFQRKFG